MEHVQEQEESSKAKEHQQAVAKRDLIHSECRLVKRKLLPGEG